MIKYIDRIIILNCPDQIDRLNYQRNQCKLYNLKYEIYNCEHIDKANGFMNTYIKSCYLSHIKIIKKIIDLNAMCLILEDDVILSSSIDAINKDINMIITNEAEWDMIYLYSINKPLIKQKNIGYNLAKFVLNTHAYIINPTSLNKIYKELVGYYYTIDKAPSKYMQMCHIDRIYAHKIHPHLKVFCTDIDHFIQNKTFGSTLGWGWNNTERIIQE